MPVLYALHGEALKKKSAKIDERGGVRVSRSLKVRIRSVSPLTNHAAYGIILALGVLS